ncbi:putative amino acid ABC transporter, permease protein [Acrocarpospora pleiomorpha]|uniref:Putative amino acid ABC transporter, permease protein n=1 Tax=Acrocarpospora pleiomorpha TaxID=90975 RepID=A0A5M3XK79_9ACTN|nr:amino acid ABC transporter permease [Acrocarpospora pleiomorpha]GES20051.1 putative amino acid ABC transporter, permease protein [Acrocarpospora pleiomorpha]
MSAPNVEHAAHPAEIGSEPGPPRPDTPALAGRRHPGRWVAGSVALAIVAAGAWSLARNPAMEWDVVAEYFLATPVLEGLWLTVWLTVAVTTTGFVAGIAVAAMRLSANPVLRAISWAYVWFFRSVPVLVQLLFWFNIGYLYPTLSLGIPGGPTLLSGSANDLISATTAALLGLTLHEAAHAGEIIRGGILAVDPGQVEAGNALGLRRSRIFRRVVLPQAMRSIVPATGNLLIGTLKGTSMVSVIAVNDLLYSVQFIYNRTYAIVPLLTVATAWYLIVTSLLSVAQYYVERHFARGARRPPPSPWHRVRAAWRSR